MRTLLLIDIQTGFEAPGWGARNNPDAEARAGTLLRRWRGRGGPVIHVRHLSAAPGSPLARGGAGTTFRDEVAPIAGEPVVEKSVNSAFIGTDLRDRLDAAGARELVMAGLTTPHCVSTTARMAANFGFGVVLAHDACAAFAANADMGWAGADAAPLSPAAIHDGALAHLHGEFATVRSVADILQDPA